MPVLVIVVDVLLSYYMDLLVVDWRPKTFVIALEAHFYHKDFGLDVLLADNNNCCHSYCHR